MGKKALKAELAELREKYDALQLEIEALKRENDRLRRGEPVEGDLITEDALSELATEFKKSCTD